MKQNALKSNYFVLLILIFYPLNIFSTDFTCANPKEFIELYNEKEYSKLLLIGNTVLCADNDYNGICEDPGSSRNNDINMINNDYDDTNGTSDNATTTLNSSAAYLDVPSGKEVVYAGLYWQGYMVGWSDAQKELGHNIKYKHADDTYQSSSAGEMNWVYFSSSRMYYQSYLDITDYVNTHGGGYYWVGDIATQTGKPDGGSYGAWSILVVYKDYDEEFNNITVFHGYNAVAGSGDADTAESYAKDNGCDTKNTGVGTEVSSTLSGFYTPKQDTVISTLAVFAGEGDKGADGDSGYITDINATDHILSNAKNSSTDIMNASISNNGVSVTTGLPYYSDNSLGIDIDTFDVSSIINNEQTSTTITFNTAGDGYMPGMYALQTQLYVPKFCYDYAYKYNGTFFTEDNNGSNDPYIKYNSDLSLPSGTDKQIEVTLYFKNQIDSDITAQNMKVSILDINTSQLEYVNDSTKRQLVGDPTATSKTDLEWGTSVSSSYMKDLDIGTQVSNDYFYVYYSLQPKVTTTLNNKITAQLTYDLILPDDTSVPYTLNLSSNIEMCSTSNLHYTPARGIFNVVHSAYYNPSDNNEDRHYNLPTQITNRAGDFSVIAIDDDFTDTVDHLIDVNTTFFVEMVDMSGIHLTDAACMELDRNISDKKLFMLNNQSMISIANDFNATYYQRARKNVAFRISYNVLNEEGDFLTVVTGADGSYKIKQFPDYTTEPCNIVGSSEKVSTACESAAGDSTTFTNGLTMNELEHCMECIFGKLTKQVCSRDNFSIRPEAIMLKLNDQNQTNGGSDTRFADTISGVASPTTGTTNVAAGYNYSLEITAVNHLDNTRSYGYSPVFNSDNNQLTYKWYEPSAVTCNDEEYKSLYAVLTDGYSDTNASFSQIGFYTLGVIDNTWTQVDSDSSVRSHHDIDPYLQGSSTFDCVENSSDTILEGASGLNGCNISSNHDADASGLKYRDYNINIHPYKFDVSDINATTGIDENPLTANGFIYMSDLNTTEDMALHLNGDIKAVGHNGAVLSNFTTGCYAKDIKVTLENNVTVANNPLYHYRYHNEDHALSDVNGTLDSTNNFITLPATNFRADQNGSLRTKLHLNFDRKTNIALNPRRVSYENYNIECSTPSECRFNADLLSDKETEGNVTISKSVNYLYGRTNSPRKIFSGNSGVSPIYFETYCNATDGFGVACNKTLLPNGTDSNTTNDPRWFVNTKHTANDGVVGYIYQKNATRVSATNPAPFGPTTNVSLTYDEDSGYPYKATMDHNASKWLIYDKYDANEDKNEFEVEFSKSASSWGGVDDANSTSQTQQNPKTNRRIMW